MEWLIIGVVAALTAILSALAGLGGGVILLVVIAQFFDPTTAIPIHGSIQLVSNGLRATMLRHAIAWRPVGWSSVLVVPASLLGFLVATSIPTNATRMALGCFVLIVAWRPQLLKWRGQQRLPDVALIGVGAVSGFLSSTVGASGPVTSPFYKSVTATHVSFVATAATTQVLTHASKLMAFGVGGFRIADHSGVILAGAFGVVIGTRVGTWLLGRSAEARLDVIFRWVLSALALRLIVTAAL